MKSLAYVFAALLSLAIVAPTVASAGIIHHKLPYHKPHRHPHHHH